MMVLSSSPNQRSLRSSTISTLVSILLLNNAPQSVTHDPPQKQWKSMPGRLGLGQHIAGEHPAWALIELQEHTYLAASAPCVDSTSFTSAAAASSAVSLALVKFDEQKRMLSSPCVPTALRRSGAESARTCHDQSLQHISLDSNPFPISVHSLNPKP
jgi:hypothetical protein